MNRKGWLGVVEAFLGFMIITCFSFMQMKNAFPRIKENVLLIERALLKEITRNTSMRSEIMEYGVLSSGPFKLTGNDIIVRYADKRLAGGLYLCEELNNF